MLPVRNSTIIQLKLETVLYLASDIIPDRWRRDERNESESTETQRMTRRQHEYVLEEERIEFNQLRQ